MFDAIDLSKARPLTTALRREIATLEQGEAQVFFVGRCPKHTVAWACRYLRHEFPEYIMTYRHVDGVAFVFVVNPKPEWR